MGGYVGELLEMAADAGADKHCQSIRYRDPETARGIIVQLLRRSWGMAAFRENACLIVRRLGRVGDARASATIRNSESTNRRLRRVYENAAEHCRCVSTAGKHGRRQTTLGESGVAKPAECNLGRDQKQVPVFIFKSVTYQ